MSDEPRNIEELQEYIVRYADKIFVREQFDGKWDAYSLAELPSMLARKHAMRFVAEGRIPVRVRSDAEVEAAQKGACVLTHFNLSPADVKDLKEMGETRRTLRANPRAGATGERGRGGSPSPVQVTTGDRALPVTFVPGPMQFDCIARFYEKQAEELEALKASSLALAMRYTELEGVAQRLAGAKAKWRVAACFLGVYFVAEVALRIWQKF